jgi:hypothetical protein
MTVPLNALSKKGLFTDLLLDVALVGVNELVRLNKVRSTFCSSFIVFEPRLKICLA